jgi:hypothetical protein
MKTQKQGAFVRQTSTPKIQHYPVQVVVVMPPIVNFTMFKIGKHLAKADITLNWFIAELESERSKTATQ